MEGIHSVVSRNLVSGTLVLIVGEACDVLGVLDGLRKFYDKKAVDNNSRGLLYSGISVWDLYSGSSTRWDSLSCVSFPKIRYPRRYCPFGTSTMIRQYGMLATVECTGVPGAIPVICMTPSRDLLG